MQALEARKARAWMSDKEWFESGGSKVGEHRDFSRDATKHNIDNSNNPQADLTPEKEMWVAVFRQAMEDAEGKQGFMQKPCEDGCNMRHTVQECAKEWLASQDLDWCCSMLGLEPQYVRKMLKGGAPRTSHRSRNTISDAQMKVVA